MSQGYEYRIVSYCPRTNKPRMAPIVWSHHKNPMPVYGTCSCWPDCDKEKRRAETFSEVPEQASRLEKQTEKLKQEVVIEYRRTKQRVD